MFAGRYAVARPQNDITINLLHTNFTAFGSKGK